MFLEEILTAVEQETSIAPTAFNSRIENHIPAINYTLYRASDDGAVAQWRLQIRITAETFQEVMDIEGKVRDLLTTVGDEYKYNCVIHINGGGTLEDEMTGYPQQLIYFDVITRG